MTSHAVRPVAPETETAATPPARLLLPRLEVVVRAAREADLPALEWHGGADLRSFYRGLWEQHQSGAISMLVADFNAFPIGLAALYWRGKETHSHLPDLQSLRVLPAFRGLGIGSILLQTAEQQTRAAGYAQISLSVSVDNVRARRLYERREYSAWGEPYSAVWSYRDAAGRLVRVEEVVLDMVKNLKKEQADADGQTSRPG
jgi:ribosomal protein S18 acetylase RimI-like enzyme